MPDQSPPNTGQRSNATVAHRLAEAFARHGVELTFGQSLPSAFHLASPSAGIRQIVYRQENAGGSMADGYARISHKIGVVTAQNGPAATLLVAPLAEALKASVPVLALVQEVDRSNFDRNAFQELDHQKLFEPVAKWVRRIDRADRLDDYVDMAFTAAGSGRPGPAVLLVPADLLNEVAAVTAHRRADLGRYPLDRCCADPAIVAEAARRLLAARSPLVVAGGGVHISDAAEELAALQRDAHLPVATTNMGKGAVSEDDPLTLGVIGSSMGLGSRTHAMRALVDEADVILFVGTRTNQNATDSWKLFPRGASFIHIDPDPMEIGRNYEALRLVGDAKLTLDALRRAMLAAGTDARLAGRVPLERKVAAGVAAWRSTVAAICARDGGPVRPERVMAEIEERLRPDDIVAADASYSSIWVANYLTARRPGQRFLLPRGLAGLGWGVPLAIGAKLARPDSRVICVVGDGGFGHSWAELETLQRLRSPITVILLNNGILGYQKHAEDVKFGDHTDAIDFAPVDHAAIARACGIDGVTVTRGEDVGAALDAALGSGRSTVIEVMTDPDAKPPISFYAGHYAEPF